MHVVDFLQVLLMVWKICLSKLHNAFKISLYGITMSSLDTKTEIPSILTHSPFINGNIPSDFSHDINELCRPG